MICRRRIIFWVFLLSGLVAFALAMAYRWFERGGAFNLDIVRIQGIRHADSSAVCQVIAPLFGTSIWQIDPVELQNSLEEIPGIDSVTVCREPLTGMVLQIKLANPVFAISDSTGTVAVSSSGERLPSTFLKDSIPVIEAPGGMCVSVSATLARWFETEEIVWDSLLFQYSDTGFSVFMIDGCEILLGNDNLSGRWSKFCSLNASLSDIGDWEQVDMRYIGQAVFRRKSVEGFPSGEGS